MPAPTEASLEKFLTDALLEQGFGKMLYNPAGIPIPVVPPELPDAMQKLVKAQARGISAQWRAWQATQIVTIPITSSPGSPSIGVPTMFPPGGLVP